MNKDSTLRIDKALGVIEKIIPELNSIDESRGDAHDGHSISPAVTHDDIENDYKYQRENLYSLIERGQDAIDGILELAKESEHPRTYEVALNGIKQVAEVTEKLGELQEKMRKLKELPNHAPRTVNNALYVGSTAELQRMLKEK